MDKPRWKEYENTTNIQRTPYNSSFSQDFHQSSYILLQHPQNYRMFKNVNSIRVVQKTITNISVKDLYNDITSYPQPENPSYFIDQKLLDGFGTHVFNTAISKILHGKNKSLRNDIVSLVISDTYDTSQGVCSILLEPIYAENEIIATSWTLYRAPEGSYIIVLEYAELGDLREYLKEKFAEITWKEKIDISRQKNILAILSGKRETPVPGTPCEYIEIYRRCWDENPNRRPSVNDVFERLGEEIMVTGPVFKGEEKCCENHPHRELTSKWLETKISETDSISSPNSSSNVSELRLIELFKDIDRLCSNQPYSKVIRTFKQNAPNLAVKLMEYKDSSAD
ncbi:18570_t:CDS:2 [Acaulospora morrowiae]|uniref:18570_t:CDS:1 n=1 Tax=Acaulospora morrowiae TaxID=94023 RepID=A0A9N9ARD4_9GLOM|nr:18570_t:CDS:2 [Acaulospora morrowiae]